MATPRRYDPTQTTGLRNKFSSEMWKRFTRLYSDFIILRNIRIFDKCPVPEEFDPRSINPFEFIHTGRFKDPFLAPDLAEIIERGDVSARGVNDEIRKIAEDYRKEADRLRKNFNLGGNIRYDSSPEVIKEALKLHSDEYLLANPGSIVCTPIPQKMEAFEIFLERRLRKYILDEGTTDEEDLRIRFEQINQTAIDERYWTDEFVEEAYRKGSFLAAQGLIQNGIPEETQSASGSLKDIIATGAALHLLSQTQKDSLGFFKKATFSELSTISQNLRHDITRIVGQGLLAGTSSRDIVGSINYLLSHKGTRTVLVDSLGRRYATIDVARQVARTEITRIVNESALDMYSEFGVNEVTADVEMKFSTQQDRFVCPICLELEGTLYSIDAARGLLPLHPNCRCFFQPVIKRRPSSILF